MAARPLQEMLAGTWRLESYTSLPTPTSSVQRPTYPMTKNVVGLIMYTADGYMSAQMLIPGQKGFDGSHDTQWAEAAKRCFTYAGPYYVSNDGPGQEECLRHHFELCILPDRVGEVELRTHRFEEDGQVLVLGGTETVEIMGDQRIPVLRWRKAPDNTNASPPAALPEIRIG